MLEGIQRGDKVVTSSGMHGTVTDINGTEYVIQIADNVRVTFDKAAISAKK
jgi:preprotein translocase YajC subunit